MKAPGTIQWLGKVGACDICGTKLNALPSFADCVIDRRSWIWGLICTYCLEKWNLKIALSYGKLHQSSGSENFRALAQSKTTNRDPI